MENELIFTQERNISSAFIDSSLKMGIAQSVLMVQDNLTECFSRLGCDGVVYREKYKAFWVFTKSKLHFEKRPVWREKIDASTFPIDNAGFKAHINTILRDKNGETLITANQEACVLSLDTHRPVKITTLPYPTEGFPKPAFNPPFERFPSDFSEDEISFVQEIRSCHIDMSRHMNNIEYIKFALSVFTDDFLQSHEITDIEVHYTGESKEGQILKVYRRDDPECRGKTFVHIKEGERSVFECCIRVKAET